MSDADTLRRKLGAPDDELGDPPDFEIEEDEVPAGTLPSITISISRTVQPVRFEAAQVFYSLQGITADTTPEEMDYMLSHQGKIAYDKLIAVVRRRAEELREEN